MAQERVMERMMEQQWMPENPLGLSSVAYVNYCQLTLTCILVIKTQNFHIRSQGHEKFKSLPPVLCTIIILISLRVKKNWDFL